jgi:hypothetical protein
VWYVQSFHIIFFRRKLFLARSIDIKAYERTGELQAEADCLQAQLREASERTAALVESNAALVGHTNPNQKIHQLMKLKEGMLELQRDNAEWRQRASKADAHEKHAVLLAAQLAAALSAAPPRSPAPVAGGGHDENGSVAKACSPGEKAVLPHGPALPLVPRNENSERV